jgi:hypothetical protein
MDVYNDTPTIVTTWLTIIPKLSILILLLELYLQIDFLENNNFFFNIYSDYYLNVTLTFNNIIDYCKFIGGEDWYEPNKLFGNYTLNQFVEYGVRLTLYESIVSTWYSWLSLVNTPWGIKTFGETLLLGQDWIPSLGGGSSALYNLLFISSLLSLIIGTVLGLAQSQIKRLMAWDIWEILLWA